MNHQTNRCYPLLSGLLLLLLAACSQDTQPAANVSSFSFAISPAAGTVSLNKLGPTALAAQADGTCGADTPRILTPGDELKVSDYTFVFSPGNTLKITASFTNTTDFAFEQPFSFSSDQTSTTNIVSSAEPTVTDADLGGDGKLSPDETTTVLTFTVEHKGQAFRYEVSAEANVNCAETDPTEPNDPTDPVDPEPEVCSDPVAIPDTNLEAAIRDELGKQTGELTCADLESLTGLEATGRAISNLESLQYAVNLEVLELRNNQLSTLISSTFAGMTKLRFLALSRNQLTTIEDGTFAGLTSLVYLAISDSPLSTLGSGAFSGLDNLETLYLVSNQLSTLSSNIFAGLSKLEDLDLNTNQLTSFSSGTFDGLVSLQFLNLGSNQLSTLTAFVEDESIGDGSDRIFLRRNCLTSLQAQNDINTLEGRNPNQQNIEATPQGNDQCPL